MACGFNGMAAAAISIIGGADGPTSIFLAVQACIRTSCLGPIAVAAYSYMALVPLIQPPIMKAFTSEKERKIKMESAASGIQAGAYPVPDHYYHRCLHDPAYYSSSGRYADAG